MKEIQHLKDIYGICLENIGTSHREAAKQPDINSLKELEAAQKSTEAVLRGAKARKKQRDEKFCEEQRIYAPIEQIRLTRNRENMRSFFISSLPKKSAVHKKCSRSPKKVLTNISTEPERNLNILKEIPSNVIVPERRETPCSGLNKATDKTTWSGDHLVQTSTQACDKVGENCKSVHKDNHLKSVSHSECSCDYLVCSCHSNEKGIRRRCHSESTISSEPTLESKIPKIRTRSCSPQTVRTLNYCSIGNVYEGKEQNFTKVKHHPKTSCTNLEGSTPKTLNELPSESTHTNKELIKKTEERSLKALQREQLKKDFQQLLRELGNINREKLVARNKNQSKARVYQRERDILTKNENKQKKLADAFELLLKTVKHSPSKSKDLSTNMYWPPLEPSSPPTLNLATYQQNNILNRRPVLGRQVISSEEITVSETPPVTCRPAFDSPVQPRTASRAHHSGQQYSESGQHSGRAQNSEQRYSESGQYSGRAQNSGQQYSESGQYSGRAQNSGQQYSESGQYSGRAQNSGQQYSESGQYSGRAQKSGQQYSESGQYSRDEQQSGQQQYSERKVQPMADVYNANGRHPLVSRNQDSEQDKPQRSQSSPNSGTSYYSLPDHLTPSQKNLLDSLLNQVETKRLNKKLKIYIQRLLSMSRESIENLATSPRLDTARGSPIENVDESMKRMTELVNDYADRINRLVNSIEGLEPCVSPMHLNLPDYIAPELIHPRCPPSPISILKSDPPSPPPSPLEKNQSLSPPPHKDHRPIPVVSQYQGESSPDSSQKSTHQPNIGSSTLNLLPPQIGEIQTPFGLSCNLLPNPKDYYFQQASCQPQVQQAQPSPVALDNSIDAWAFAGLPTPPVRSPGASSIDDEKLLEEVLGYQPDEEFSNLDLSTEVKKRLGININSARASDDDRREDNIDKLPERTEVLSHDQGSEADWNQGEFYD